MVGVEAGAAMARGRAHERGGCGLWVGRLKWDEEWAVRFWRAKTTKLPQVTHRSTASRVHILPKSI